MTREEKLQLTEIIAAAAELMRAELSPIGLKLYLDALDDLDFERVRQAFGRLVRSQKFMPAPAEVRGSLGQLDGDIDSRAVVEAARVIATAKQIGEYDSVVFDDPVTMAVLNYCHGGWPGVYARVIDPEAEKWFRQEFEKQYRAFSRSGLYSGGRLEGRHPRRVCYIGDHDRALEVEGSTGNKFNVESRLLIGEGGGNANERP